MCVCVYRCMCKVGMYCNYYSISVTETMVVADKNIDLMLKKFKLMILNILNFHLNFTEVLGLCATQS